MAERLVYLPSAFFILAVVLAGLSVAASAGARRRQLVAAGTAVVVVLFAAGTVVRNQDWLTPLALYRAAVAAAPQSAKSRHLLGNELAASGSPHEAVEQLVAGAAIDPENFVLRTNTARALARLGRYDEALPHLEAALTTHPGHRPAFELVCAIFERTGRPAAAGPHCFPLTRGREPPPHVNH